MGILFRPQRGSLYDALENVREVENLQDIIDETTEMLSHYGLSPKPDEFHVEYYCEDARIGWTTYVITLDNYGVVGFTNGMIE